MDTQGEMDRVSKMDKGKKEPRARRTFTPEYKEGAGRLVLDESRLRKENRELRMERELLQNHPEGFRSVEPETPRRAMAASVRKERPSAFW